jgi:mannosyltransferase
MAVVPPAALLAASYVTDPLWVPRYVLFALAPIAMLAAVTLHGRGVLALVACAMVFAASVPTQLEIRGPATHHGPNFRQVAAIISENQGPGDGIVYGKPGNWSLRAGVDYYLAGKPAPRDLLLGRPAAEVGRLGAQECANTAACVGDTSRIWLIRLFQQTDPLAAAGPIAPILRAKYHSVRTWQVTKGTIALYERRP